MKYYLGIDPGLGGALALLDCDGKFCELVDIPIMMKNKGTGTVKNCINSKGLQNILSYFVAEYGECTAYLENVNAMPGQGVSSVFSLGDTFGAIRTALICQNLELNLIPPQTWKKYMKLTSDKEMTRAMAIRLFPKAAEYLARKKDHDRAEALLIAKYAYEVNK